MKLFILGSLLLLASCLQPPRYHSADGTGAAQGADQTLENGDEEKGGPASGEDAEAPDPLPAPAPIPVLSPSPMPTPSPSPSPTLTPAPELAPAPIPVALVPKPWAPCPESGNCLIMPYGDSITFGQGSAREAGYRVPLIQKIWAANQLATFVGVNQSGPDTVDGKAFPRSNDGFSGYTIENGPKASAKGIAEMAVAHLNQLKPHIITLMVGTNDVNQDNDLSQAPARLAKLVDTIITNRPDALLVIAKIVPRTDSVLDDKTRAYNAGVQKVADERIAKGKHIILVDMFSAMSAQGDWKTAFYNDPIHPKEAGYEVMSKVWYGAISKYLIKSP